MLVRAHRAVEKSQSIITRPRSRASG